MTRELEKAIIRLIDDYLENGLVISAREGGLTVYLEIERGVNICLESDGGISDAVSAVRDQMCDDLSEINDRMLESNDYLLDVSQAVMEAAECINNIAKATAKGRKGARKNGDSLESTDKS